MFMRILTSLKPENASIDDVIDFFDNAFQGLGFKKGSYVDDALFFEVFYVTEDSGHIHAKYAKDKPFSAFIPGEINKFHVYFELADMSPAYEEKIADFIMHPDKY